MITFKDFLKQTTNITKKFIDDFFSLYTSETKSGDMVVNFNKLTKWLNIRKDSLKRTLIKTYNKNIDYEINKIKSNKAGKPKEEIMITAECCKRLCMLSKSKNAENVRTYFIDIEKIIEKVSEKYEFHEIEKNSLLKASKLLKDS